MFNLVIIFTLLTLSLTNANTNANINGLAPLVTDSKVLQTIRKKYDRISNRRAQLVDQPPAPVSSDTPKSCVVCTWATTACVVCVGAPFSVVSVVSVLSVISVINALTVLYLCYYFVKCFIPCCMSALSSDRSYIGY